MNDIVLIMKVIKAKTKLAKPRNNLMFGYFLKVVSLDVLVKVTLLSQFENQNQELFILKHFLNLNNIGMTERQQQFSLKVEIMFRQRDLFHSVKLLFFLAFLFYRCSDRLSFLHQIYSALFSFAYFSYCLVMRLEQYLFGGHMVGKRRKE